MNQVPNPPPNQVLHQYQRAPQPPPAQPKRYVPQHQPSVQPQPQVPRYEPPPELLAVGTQTATELLAVGTQTAIEIDPGAAASSSNDQPVFQLLQPRPLDPARVIVAAPKAPHKTLVYLTHEQTETQMALRKVQAALQALSVRVTELEAAAQWDNEWDRVRVPVVAHRALLSSSMPLPNQSRHNELPRRVVKSLPAEFKYDDI